MRARGFQRADRAADQIGLEGFGNVDDLVDGGEHLLALRIERHHAQVEAGLRRIIGGVAEVRRFRVADEIARRLRAVLARVMRDQRRVDAAAEQGRDRQAGRQAKPHRLRQNAVEPARIVRDRRVGARIDRRLEARAALARQRIARRQQHDRRRLDRVEQRPHLRAEQKAALGLDDVKRLDAERVARGEEFPARHIDRHKGIHADEALERAIAPGLQRIGQHFGVGFGVEFDAEIGQFPAQFEVVVDLAVEGNRQPAIERDLRLHGVLGVDDSQPPGGERAVLARRDDRVGHVAAVQNARNQQPDGEFRVRPIDRDRNSAHENASPSPQPVGCSGPVNHIAATVNFGLTAAALLRRGSMEPGKLAHDGSKAADDSAHLLG